MNAPRHEATAANPAAGAGAFAVTESAHIIAASITDPRRPLSQREVILSTAVLGLYGWSVTYREPTGHRGCQCPDCAAGRHWQGRPELRRLRQRFFSTRDAARAAVVGAAQWRLTGAG